MWHATRALVLKELQHHAWFALSMLLMLVPAALMMLVSSMSVGGVSFTSSALGLVYYWEPVVALALARRLIVLEYSEETHRFLAALPPPAWLCVSVKLVIGLLLTLLIGLLPCAGLLALAATRELVTLGWFIQLLTESALYLSGWFMVSALLAHMGRYRHWMWLALLAVVNMLPEHIEWASWLWTAPMADPFDATRSFVPWDGLLVGTLWTIGCGVLCLMLGTFRGGALVSALYGIVPTRSHLIGASAVLSLLMVTSVITEPGDVQLTGWDRFETVGTSQPPVRVSAARLRPQGTALATALTRTATLTDPAGPAVVLVPGARPDEDGLYGISHWSADAQTLVLRVHHPTSTGLVADAVLAVLSARAADGLQWNPLHQFLLGGVSVYAADPDGTLMQRRAAFALAQGIGREDLEDRDALRRRLGDDILNGLAALAVDVLIEHAGVDRVRAALSASLFSLPGPSPATLASLMPEAAFLDAWHDRIRAAAAQADGDGTAPPPSAHLDRHFGSEVSWGSSTPLPARTTLMVRTIAPIRRVAMGDVWQHPLDADTGSFSTWAPPHLDIDATLGRYDAELEGVVISGWIRLERVAP